MPCQALTKKGKPCRNPVVLDTGYCLSHSPKEIGESRGFGGSQPGAGRPRRPREIELIQQVADEYKEQLRAVYADGLTADRAVVVGNGPTAHVETVPDHPHRHRVAESIYDRLHGRPHTTVAATVDTRSVTFDFDVSNPDTRELIAELLRRRPAASAQ